MPTPASGTLIDVPAVLPVGHPNNPGSTPLPFEYTFFDLGPRLKDNTQVFYRALAGVRGSGERWDWEVAALTSQSAQREYVDNFVNRYAFEQILRDGSYNFSTRPARRARWMHCACRPSVRAGTSCTR